ncbi:MAG: hypothetical protein GY839_11315 [candidate division Zixibacteria bacterium]|nr:hypothetical protein [candidate division Zixibacteria bacterium]
MGTLACRLEMSKIDGITITVVNSDDGITQTVEINGQTITIKSDGDETSTITMAPESIKMKCKTFKLDAETIECNSEKETKLSSGKNYEISSDADLNMAASQNIDMSAKLKCDITGGTNASLVGKMTDVEGKILNVTGKMTTVDGQITKVSGNLVKLG